MTVRINFKKLGFKRNELRDFKDDGNSFKGYRYGNNVDVVYLQRADMIFLTIRVSNERVRNWDRQHLCNAWRLSSHSDAFNGFDSWNWSKECEEKLVTYCKELEELLNKSDKELYTMIDSLVEKERARYQDELIEEVKKNVVRLDEYGKSKLIELLKLNKIAFA